MNDKTRNLTLKECQALVATAAPAKKKELLSFTDK
jgi:hypothetical protein